MIYIFLATLLYSATILVGTYASRAANTTIVAAIINIVSAVIPTLVAIPLLNKVNVQNQRLGFIAALIAGVLIALFTMTLTKSYSLNKVSVVAPIVFGGSILISSILSTFVFKEKISLIEGLGLGMLAIGLLIIIYARFTGK